MSGVILSFFNRIKSWFANIEIKVGNICLFGRSYKTELYIVCDSLEQWDKDCSGKGNKAARIVKRVISSRMAHARLDDQFDRFLKQKKIMDDKK